MPTILPSINDRKLKGRYRGEVYLFGDGERKTIAVVYGATLEEMRARKHATSDALRQLTKESEADDG